MAKMVKGALIEYGVDLIGPIPNVIVFQFNPERVTRDIQIPERPNGSARRETSQAGELPVEKITFTAYFDAADKLGNQEPISEMFGIGPQLTALEKMSRPAGKKGLLGEAIDAIAGALGGGSSNATQSIPRVQFPRVLMIWGPMRVLPVIIESLRITEQRFDSVLNPVSAEVAMTVSVVSINSADDDWLGYGAQLYTTTVKEVQAVANLIATIPQVTDVIPF
jgi:hypothetical protein